VFTDGAVYLRINLFEKSSYSWLLQRVTSHHHVTEVSLAASHMGWPRCRAIEGRETHFMRIITKVLAAAVSLTVNFALLHQSAVAQTLPGYSARPDGMCWTREFGSGQDITGGYWAACPKQTGNSSARTTANARATQRREPAATEAHASATQHLPASEPIYFDLATGTE
jgi:hypothetical protein